MIALGRRKTEIIFCRLAEASGGLSIDERGQSVSSKEERWFGGSSWHRRHARNLSDGRYGLSRGCGSSIKEEGARMGPPDMTAVAGDVAIAFTGTHDLSSCLVQARPPVIDCHSHLASPCTEPVPNVESNMIFVAMMGHCEQILGYHE